MYTHDGTTPLIVDVDGTLVSGDLLIEGIARLLAVFPLRLLVLPFWFAEGRAALKRRIAQAVPLSPKTLTFNPVVLNEIAVARAAGREVWLASAADELAIAPIAEHLGVTGYLASDGELNLIGEAKAAALVERFGRGRFDYIGNEQRDLPIWKRARRAIGVGLTKRLARKVKSLNGQARFLPGIGGTAIDWLRALRPYQWVKNLLVFVPLLAAHATEVKPYLVAAGIFAALSAIASGAYLLNDLLDLPHDRQHASKCRRPLAAGKVPLLPMIALSAVLMVGGLAMAFALSVAAGLYALLYLVLAVTYSLLLKRKTFIDVITLAALYTIRALAGAAAAAIALSPWFMAFFLFIFLSLAIVKRQSELYTLRESNQTEARGRTYVTEDLTVLVALGTASGFAAVIILILYINNPQVSAHYAQPELLWLVCPLLIYWLGRMVLLANRGIVADDPLTFALHDRTSWLTSIGILAVLLGAL